MKAKLFSGEQVPVFVDFDEAKDAGGNSTFVALTFSRFEARTRSTGLSGCEPPNSSHAVFACGVSGRYWLWSVAELHGKVAASRRGSWSGSESPSTEDVCLRC